MNHRKAKDSIYRTLEPFILMIMKMIGTDIPSPFPNFDQEIERACDEMGSDCFIRSLKDKTIRYDLTKGTRSIQWEVRRDGENPGAPGPS